MCAAFPYFNIVAADFPPRFADVAERIKAVVLKTTGRDERSVGSNPTICANAGHKGWQLLGLPGTSRPYGDKNAAVILDVEPGTVKILGTCIVREIRTHTIDCSAE